MHDEKVHKKEIRHISLIFSVFAYFISTSQLAASQRVGERQDNQSRLSLSQAKHRQIYIGKIKTFSPLELHVSGMWKKTKVPGENQYESLKATHVELTDWMKLIQINCLTTEPWCSPLFLLLSLF